MRVKLSDNIIQVIGSIEEFDITEHVSTVMKEHLEAGKFDETIIYEEGDRIVVKLGKNYFTGICEGDVEFGKNMGNSKGYSVLLDDGNRQDVKSKQIIGLTLKKSKKPITKEDLKDYLAEVSEE